MDPSTLTAVSAAAGAATASVSASAPRIGRARARAESGAGAPRNRSLDGSRRAGAERHPTAGHRWCQAHRPQNPPRKVSRSRVVRCRVTRPLEGREQRIAVTASGARIPDRHRALVVHGVEAAVVAEVHAVDVGRQLEDSEGSAAVGIPDTDGAVGATGCQQGSAGVERDRADPPRVT